MDLLRVSLVRSSLLSVLLLPVFYACAYGMRLLHAPDILSAGKHIIQ